MLQQLLGYDVIDTGFVLAPRGIGVLITMQMAGWLLRKNIDPRIIVTAGFVLSDYSLWQMAHWSLAVDRTHVITSGVIQGLGVGFVFMPLNLTAFATIAARLRTDASSMLNLSRNVGSSVGISVVSVYLAKNIQTVHASLGQHVTAATGSMFDYSTVDRFQSLGDVGLRLLDAEVNRQAAMVAYIDDFYLMFWLTLLTTPIVLLMRRARPGATPAREPPPH
jgi:DHA2 family multidrug resistance protein